MEITLHRDGLFHSYWSRGYYLVLSKLSPSISMSTFNVCSHIIGPDQETRERMCRGLPPPELRALYQTSPYAMVMIRVHEARGLQDLNSFSQMSPLVRAIAVSECDRARASDESEVEMFRSGNAGLSSSSSFSSSTSTSGHSRYEWDLSPFPPEECVVNPDCGGVAETDPINNGGIEPNWRDVDSSRSVILLDPVARWN